MTCDGVLGGWYGRIEENHINHIFIGIECNERNKPKIRFLYKIEKKWTLIRTAKL